MKLLKALRIVIFKKICTLMHFIFLRDSTYYYGRYFGTDHVLVLIVKNILNPKRFIKKLLYGQVIPIPFALSAADEAKELPELSDEWKIYLETLKQDGIVFIPSFFKERAELISNRYKLNKQEFPASDKYYRFVSDLGDDDLLNITVDSMMLSILSKYYGCQPYYRQQPSINVTHPGDDQIGYNDFWHYDTVNQMTAHILLCGTSESDSCMLYAKGSHRTHKQYISTNDYYYSDEYINENFDIVSCFGEPGTLVIFDPNGLHRADLKPSTFRSHLHLNYVPGNDLLNGEKYKNDSLSVKKLHTDLLELNAYQTRSLSKLI
jgi:hypothetical protein